jgi:hypothetical protein
VVAKVAHKAVVALDGGLELSGVHLKHLAGVSCPGSDVFNKGVGLTLPECGGLLAPQGTSRRNNKNVDVAVSLRHI